MKRTLITIAILLAGFSSIAQPGPPGESPTPFGFIELLMAGGAVLGGAKLLNKKEEE